LHVGCTLVAHWLRSAPAPSAAATAATTSAKASSASALEATPAVEASSTTSATALGGMPASGACATTVEVTLGRIAAADALKRVIAPASATIATVGAPRATVGGADAIAAFRVAALPPSSSVRHPGFTVAGTITTAVAVALTTTITALVTPPFPLSIGGAVRAAPSAVAPAKIIAPVGAAHVVAVALARGAVPIGHALAVTGVMLPLAALHVRPIEAAIDIGGAIDVDIHIATAPVAVREQGTGRGKAYPPRKAGHQCATRVVRRIWRPVIRRIGR